MLVGSWMGSFLFSTHVLLQLLLCCATTVVEGLRLWQSQPFTTTWPA